jgi:Resolvase, N terminal domain
MHWVLDGRRDRGRERVGTAMGSTTASRLAIREHPGSTGNDQSSRLDRWPVAVQTADGATSVGEGALNLRRRALPAEFREFCSPGTPLATPIARPRGVLIVLCPVTARPAVIAERTGAPAVRGRTLVVDGYVRTAAQGDWSGSPASIDRGLIGTCVVRRGWRVGQLFEEPADTLPPDRRSLLREAIERVESRESDGLIVARFKNLGSSFEEAVAALERIQAAGGRFVSVCDGIDLGASNGRTILRLLLSVLEW